MAPDPGGGGGGGGGGGAGGGGPPDFNLLLLLVPFDGVFVFLDALNTFVFVRFGKDKVTSFPRTPWLPKV